MQYRFCLFLKIWHSQPWRQASRLISLLLCLTFVIPYLSFAFEIQTSSSSVAPGILLAGKPVEIPADLGTVVKSHAGASGRVVVYLQDLHCNAEVQNHIAGIIGYLAKHHGLKVVGVEGAAHQVDVSALGSFRAPEVKQDVGQYFIRQGQITGPEFYAATGPCPVRLEGIEDPELYQANLHSVQKFLTDESQGLVYDLREMLESQKPRVFGAALQTHDRHRVLFREGKESVLNYGLYLAGALRRAGYGLEGFPQLAGYVAVHQDGFGAKVNPDDLYLEMERAEEILRGGLYAGEDARALDQLEAKLDVMEKLLNISATPAELATYRRNPASFRVKTFLQFIQAHAAPGDPEPEVELYGLDEFVKATEAFYQVADQRSQVFVNRLESRLQAARESSGVLITGGYHTGDMLAQLERQGIGYISVRPRITQTDLVNPYFSLIKGRPTPLDKLLAQNQNILSLWTRFRETGAPARAEQTTFAAELRFALAEGVTAFRADQGQSSLARLRTETQTSAEQDPTTAQIDWEKAQGNAGAGVFLIPATVGNRKAVGLIRPRNAAAEVPGNAGVIRIGKNYELVILSPEVAAGQAQALLKGGESLDLQGQAVRAALATGRKFFREFSFRQWINSLLGALKRFWAAGAEVVASARLWAKAHDSLILCGELGLLGLALFAKLPVPVSMVFLAFPALLSKFLDRESGKETFLTTFWRELTWPNRRMATIVAALGAVAVIIGLVLIIAEGVILSATISLFAFAGLMIFWGVNFYFRSKMIITLDGPDISGKREIAMDMAKSYKYTFVDTGVYLRALAVKIRAYQPQLQSPQALEIFVRKNLKILAATSLSMDFEGPNQELRVRMDSRDITTAVQDKSTQDLAAQLGRVEAVMDLVKAHILREAMESNVVVVGQSMGAFLDQAAKIKFYVTGDLRVRAENFLRQKLQGEPTSEQLMAKIMEMRQGEIADRSRKGTPLKYLSDAHVIDSARPAEAAAKVWQLMAERSSAFYPLRERWEHLRLHVSGKMLTNAQGNRVRRERLVRDGDIWIASSDVDSFSSINPFWGKGIGNVLLADIQAARLEALRLPGVKSLTRGAVSFREGGDEASLLLSPNLKPKQVEEVVDAMRIHVKASLYKKYMALEISDFEETPSNLAVLSNVVESLNKKFNRPGMFRIVTDDLVGVRLLLTASWPAGNSEYYIYELSRELERRGITGKVETLKLTDILTPENLKNLKKINLDYLEKGWIWDSTISVGATKATRALAKDRARNMQDLWARKKLTHADLTEWVEGLMHRAGDFLHQAKHGPGSAEEAYDGKDAAEVDFFAESPASAGEKQEQILMDPRLAEMIRTELLLYDDMTALRDENDQPVVDALVPWALATTALRNEARENARVLLSEHQTVEPQISIGRAPPSVGPDKIHMAVVTPGKTYLAELEGEYSGPRLEAAVRDKLNRKLTTENPALRDDPAELQRQVDTVLESYIIRRGVHGEPYFKFSLLNNLISYTTGNFMIQAPQVVLSSPEVQHWLSKRIMEIGFERALPELVAKIEEQINVQFDNPIKISLTTIYSSQETSTVAKFGLGKLFRDVYIGSLVKFGKIIAYTDDLLKPARIALKKLAEVRWNKIIADLARQSPTLAAQRARELINVFGDDRRVAELRERVFQNLDLPFTLAAFGVSAVLLALGIGLPLAAPVVLALYLATGAKLLWVVRRLQVLRAEDPNTPWTARAGAFDPISGKMVDPKTGLTISRAPIFVVAHEQYAHAWAQRLVDAWQTFWDAPTLADYSRGAETGDKPFGYYFWNIFVSEVLAHSLDFLALPFAIIHYYKLRETATTEETATAQPEKLSFWERWAPWLPESLLPGAEEILFRVAPFLIIFAMAQFSLPMIAGLAVAALFTVIFLLAKDHRNYQWSWLQWAAAGGVTLFITTVFFSVAWHGVPGLNLAAQISRFFSLPALTAALPQGLSPLNAFLATTFAIGLHYANSLLSRATQAAWPRLTLLNPPTQWQKIPKQSVGLTELVKDLSRNQELAVAVGALDGFDQYNAFVGPKVAAFLKESVLQAALKIYSEKNIRVFNLEGGRFAMVFPAGTGISQQAQWEEIFRQMSARLAEEFSRRYIFISRQALLLGDSAAARINKLQALQRALAKYDGVLDLEAPGGQAFLLLPASPEARNNIRRSLSSQGFSTIELDKLFNPAVKNDREVDVAYISLTCSLGVSVSSFVRDAYLEQEAGRKPADPNTLANAMLDWANTFYAKKAQPEYQSVFVGDRILPDELVKEPRSAIFTRTGLAAVPENREDWRTQALEAVLQIIKKRERIFTNRLLEISKKLEKNPGQNLTEMLKIIKLHPESLALLSFQQLKGLNSQVLAYVRAEYGSEKAQKRTPPPKTITLLVEALKKAWEGRVFEQATKQFKEEHKDIFDILTSLVMPFSRQKELKALEDFMRLFLHKKDYIKDGSVLMTRGRVKSLVSIFKNMLRDWNKKFPENPKRMDEIGPDDFKLENIRKIVDDVLGVTLELKTAHMTETARNQKLNLVLNQLVAFLKESGYEIREIRGKGLTESEPIQADKNGIYKVTFDPKAQYSDVKIKIAPGGKLEFGAEIQIYESEYGRLVDTDTRHDYLMKKLSLLRRLKWVVTLAGPEKTDKHADKYEAGAALARSLQCRFLDLGMLHRAAAWIAAQQRLKVNREKDVEALIKELSKLELKGDGWFFKGTRIPANLHENPDLAIEMHALGNNLNFQKFVKTRVNREADNGRLVIVGHNPGEILGEVRAKDVMPISFWMEGSGTEAPEGAIVLMAADAKGLFAAMEDALVDRVIEEGIDLFARPAFMGSGWVEQVAASARKLLALGPLDLIVEGGQQFMQSAFFEKILSEVKILLRRPQETATGLSPPLLDQELIRAVDAVFGGQDIAKQALVQGYSPEQFKQTLKIMEANQAEVAALNPAQQQLFHLLHAGIIFPEVENKTIKSLFISPQKLQVFAAHYGERFPAVLQYLLLHEIVCARNGHENAITTVDNLAGWPEGVNYRELVAVIRAAEIAASPAARKEFYFNLLKSKDWTQYRDQLEFRLRSLKAAGPAEKAAATRELMSFLDQMGDQLRGTFPLDMTEPYFPFLHAVVRLRFIPEIGPQLQDLLLKTLQEHFNEFHNQTLPLKTLLMYRIIPPQWIQSLKELLGHPLDLITAEIFPTGGGLSHVIKTIMDGFEHLLGTKVDWQAEVKDPRDPFGSPQTVWTVSYPNQINSAKNLEPISLGDLGLKGVGQTRGQDGKYPWLAEPQVVDTFKITMPKRVNGRPVIKGRTKEHKPILEYEEFEVKVKEGYYAKNGVRVCFIEQPEFLPVLYANDSQFNRHGEMETDFFLYKAYTTARERRNRELQQKLGQLYKEPAVIANDGQMGLIAAFPKFKTVIADEDSHTFGNRQFSWNFDDFKIYCEDAGIPLNIAAQASFADERIDFSGFGLSAGNPGEPHGARYVSQNQRNFIKHCLELMQMPDFVTTKEMHEVIAKLGDNEALPVSISNGDDVEHTLEPVRAVHQALQKIKAGLSQADGISRVREQLKISGHTSTETRFVEYQAVKQLGFQWQNWVAEAQRLPETQRRDMLVQHFGRLFPGFAASTWTGSVARLLEMAAKKTDVSGEAMDAAVSFYYSAPADVQENMLAQTLEGVSQVFQTCISQAEFDPLKPETLTWQEMVLMKEYGRFQFAEALDQEGIKRIGNELVALFGNLSFKMPADLDVWGRACEYVLRDLVPDQGLRVKLVGQILENLRGQTLDGRRAFSAAAAKIAVTFCDALSAQEKLNLFKPMGFYLDPTKPYVMYPGRLVPEKFDERMIDQLDHLAGKGFQFAGLAREQAHHAHLGHKLRETIRRGVNYAGQILSVPAYDPPLKEAGFEGATGALTPSYQATGTSEVREASGPLCPNISYKVVNFAFGFLNGNRWPESIYEIHGEGNLGDGAAEGVFNPATGKIEPKGSSGSFDVVFSPHGQGDPGMLIETAMAAMRAEAWEQSRNYADPQVSYATLPWTQACRDHLAGTVVYTAWITAAESLLYYNSKIAAYRRAQKQIQNLATQFKQQLKNGLPGKPAQLAYVTELLAGNPASEKAAYEFRISPRKGFSGYSVHTAKKGWRDFIQLFKAITYGGDYNNLHFTGQINALFEHVSHGGFRIYLSRLIGEERFRPIAEWLQALEEDNKIFSLREKFDLIAMLLDQLDAALQEEYDADLKEKYEPQEVPLRTEIDQFIFDLERDRDSDLIISAIIKGDAIESPYRLNGYHNKEGEKGLRDFCGLLAHALHLFNENQQDSSKLEIAQHLKAGYLFVFLRNLNKKDTNKPRQEAYLRLINLLEAGMRQAPEAALEAQIGSLKRSLDYFATELFSVSKTPEPVQIPVGQNAALRGEAGDKILKKIMKGILNALKITLRPGLAILEAANYTGQQLADIITEFKQRLKVTGVSLDTFADRAPPVREHLAKYWKAAIARYAGTPTQARLQALDPLTLPIEILEKLPEGLERDTDLDYLGVFHFNGKIYITREAFDGFKDFPEALAAVLLHEMLEEAGIGHDQAVEAVADIAGYNNEYLILLAGLKPEFVWKTKAQGIANVRAVLQYYRPELMRQYARWGELSEIEREDVRRQIYQIGSARLVFWGLSTAYDLDQAPYFGRTLSGIFGEVFSLAGLNPLGFEKDYTTPDQGKASVRYGLQQNYPDLIEAYDRWEQLSEPEQKSLRERLYRIKANELNTMGLSGALAIGEAPYFKGKLSTLTQEVFSNAGLQELGFGSDYSTLERSRESFRYLFGKAHPELLQAYAKWGELSEKQRAEFREVLYSMSGSYLGSLGLAPRYSEFFHGTLAGMFQTVFPDAGLNPLGFHLEWINQDQGIASMRFVLQRERPDLMEIYSHWANLEEPEREAFRQKVYAIKTTQYTVWGLGAFKNRAYAKGTPRAMLMLLFPEAKLTIEGFNKVSRSSPAKYQWTEGEVQSLENIRDGMQKYAPNLLAEYERFDELDQIGQEVFRQKIYALSIFNLTTWGLSGFRGESKFAGSAPLVFIKLFPKAKLERLGFRLDWTTPEQAGASVRYVLKQRRPDLVNWYARWDTLGERERESFRQTVYQLSYYEISSWGLGEALTRLGAGPDSESSYARVMQNIFDRAELNPLGFYLDWSTPKRGQDSVRYVLEKHVPDLMRAYGRWQELQPAEREAWRRQLYGINGSVLRLWGLSGAFDKNKPHGFKDGTFGVMQAVFPDAGLNALGFDLDWSTLARGIESVRYVLMREVPGLVQTYDRWDQLDPNARRALERKLAKIQTKDFLVWGLRGALRQGAPYFNGSYKQVLRMVFPKAYEQLQTPEVPAVPIAEKPAMSVLNAALSGGVYAGAAAFAGPWWLPALVAFVFGTQIALLIVIWKRYRASMSEPLSFRVWLNASRGGAVADAHNEELFAPYQGVAGVFAKEWFHLHEKFEKWLLKVFPNLGSLNHLLIAWTDAFSEIAAGLIWGRNVLRRAKLSAAAAIAANPATAGPADLISEPGFQEQRNLGSGLPTGKGTTVVFRRIMRIAEKWGVGAERQAEILQTAGNILTENRITVEDMNGPENIQKRWSPALETKAGRAADRLNAVLAEMFNSDFKGASYSEQQEIKAWLLIRLQHRYDPGYFFAHSHWVGVIAGEMALEAGRSFADVEKAQKAGWLHDAGKLLLPLSLLHKAETLTPAERALVQAHSRLGTELLTRIFPGKAETYLVDGTRHHERLNGKGYPGKLPGARVNDLTRAIALADVYEAVIARRFYNTDRRTIPEILAILNHPESFDAGWFTALNRIARKQMAERRFDVFALTSSKNKMNITQNTPSIGSGSNRPFFGPSGWLQTATGSLLRSLLSQDPQAAGQLGLRLPVEGSVSFFQGVRILLQGALLFYLATRTQGGAETAAANPAWQRLLMQSQYDETARAMLSHFGVGDFNQPAGLQSLATLSWWQRLATPFGRVERNAEGQPVVFVPGALLRPGGLFRGYLLRLLLELRLRSFYAQERVEATNAGQVSAWGWWSRSWHRIGMALAPAGYLAAQLGNDHSLLARQLRPGGELSGVYRTWARFPSAQNSRVLLSGMVYAASAGTQTEREAAARTLLNLLAAMPAWGSTMAGTWQISGKDLFLPVWLINAGPRVLPGKILKLMETLPLNIDYQKLAPGRRLENRFDQAA